MTGPNIFGLCEYSRKDLFEDTTDEILEADRFYIMHEADNVILELKQKLEDVQASAYAESVDSGMRERRLQRALWISRTEMAKTSAWVFWNRNDDYNYNKWKKVECKCRAKAEEYK